MFYKLRDRLNKNKTISGQFICNNKIATIFVTKKNDNFFFVKYGLKKYKLSINSFSNIPNFLGSYLDDYFSQERQGINNYKWLLIDYKATGRLNQNICVDAKKNWSYS